MASKKFIKMQFGRHATDFEDVTGIPGVFVCPICLTQFALHDIDTEPKILDDGHVWSEYIRDKSGSSQATLHRVLLCKRCNSESGSRGDSQAQLREELKDNEKQGIIFGDRRIQIFPRTQEGPINLQALARFEELAESGRILVQIRYSPKRNDPEQIERLLALNPNESFSVVINPHHTHSHDLARAGWITSAYLFAFYTFGYRYILHNSLGAVRKYVLASLDRNWQGDLPYPTGEVGITELAQIDYPNPEIGLVIPLDNLSATYVQVGFLNYQMTLPFHCRIDVLREVLSHSPSFEELVTNAEENCTGLYCRIECNKQNPHECMWDYVLGRPFSSLESS